MATHGTAPRHDVRNRAATSRMGSTAVRLYVQRLVVRLGSSGLAAQGLFVVLLAAWLLALAPASPAVLAAEGTTSEFGHFAGQLPQDGSWQTIATGPGASATYTVFHITGTFTGYTNLPNGFGTEEPPRYVWRIGCTDANGVWQDEWYGPRRVTVDQPIDEYVAWPYGTSECSTVSWQQQRGPSPFTHPIRPSASTSP